MSFINAKGIMLDHLGNAPVAGINVPYGTMGMGMRPVGSLGGLVPVKFSKEGHSILSPMGMPIATTINPFEQPIISNPFGGLSGMTGLTASSFNIGMNNYRELYSKNGVNVIIEGCNTDVKKVIECLESHMK